MSRFIVPADILSYSQYLKLFVLGGFVASTAFMVLFGEQGLLVLSETEARLAQVRINAERMQLENRELRLKLRRLKSRPEEVEILAGEIFNHQEEGSTIYVFDPEE